MSARNRSRSKAPPVLKATAKVRPTRAPTPLLSELPAKPSCRANLGAAARPPWRAPSPEVGPPRPPSQPPPAHLLGKGSGKGEPWYGSAGKLRGPVAWRCPKTGRAVRYMAARVAGDAAGSRAEEDEPVVLYLAGLGDAGQKDPAMVRKRHARMKTWGLRPFILLVPLRRQGYWWVVEGDESNGWLGEFRADEVELFADLVQSLAGSRPLVSIAFSAGAYCFTELLALGRPCFSAAAIGGLHGHGQSELVGIPKKYQEDCVQKFDAYLARLSTHPGIQGGLFAMHAENDKWSPNKYALEVLDVLALQNVARGCPRVRLHLLEVGGSKAGHDYEDKAIWQPEIVADLLEACSGRGAGPRLRGSVALSFSAAAEPVGALSESPGQGARLLWLPEGTEGNKEPGREMLESDTTMFEEDAAERWDASSGEVSEADVNEAEEQRDTQTDPECEEEAAIERDSADGEEDDFIEDDNSAVFKKDIDYDPWRSESTLDMESVQVEAGSCEDMPAIPAWALHAADVFRENGFVVLLGVLSPRAASKVLADCRATAKQIVNPKNPAGNRHGGKRYSFGNASSTGSLLHIPSFACHLLDNRAVLAVLEAIYASDPEPPEEEDGHAAAGKFKCVAAGGDFVLARERRFQRMHDDLSCIAKRDNVRIPPPLVSVNFVVHPITGENGPMRVVPGTQLDRGYWDGEPCEPGEWRSMRLFPLPVGAAIVRDVRTLHGGSPNFSSKARYLPAVEFASTRFLETPKGRYSVRSSSMPRSVFEKLRPIAKARVCKDVVAAGEVRPSFKKSSRRHQAKA